MSKTDASEQGSTFLWTQGYGSAECPGRRKDFVQDLFFATTWALLVFSVLGLA